MKKISIAQIENAAGARLLCGRKEKLIGNICTDSREAKEGDIFFALIGENRDAHKYAEGALQNGCTSFVMSDEAAAAALIEKAPDVDILMTQDTTRALQLLAKWYIGTFDGLKVIGVTGSNGKTSTKDMLYYICSEKYKTVCNRGNLNNHIGMPLTILSMDEGTEVAVLEMGMSAFGEIHTLVDIARPQIGLITNIGISHMEYLGSREGILKAKMEITDFFDENCVLIVNGGNDLLTPENTKGNYKLISVGEKGKQDLRISDIDDMGEEGIKFKLEHNLVMQMFELSVPGVHNASNAALAVAAGLELGITLEEAARGLSKMVLTEKRLSIRGKNGYKIIDDTYNASPDSMKSALDVLASTKGIRKVAILGDMYELGKDTQKFHMEVGAYAKEKKTDCLITVGELGKFIAQGAVSAGMKDVLSFETKAALAEKLNELVRPGDVILVKASRGLAMEEIVKKIPEQL
ncbi:MAG: UDP-N-acetylmuramoyl-tripeptide--D-alanyl-D-alanine ligase [Clostridia bacterium]|nr:UDP-N-acetylmuramoyl-tripeptide--D-alanyl-D-alanine ligase [Clostridia bacterium]